ncbi:MAG: hypothetical protein LRY71_11860 [Bacillaceae bacterium]|nr:hypothetical protein [Bacillaceae bacterium]
MLKIYLLVVVCLSILGACSTNEQIEKVVKNVSERSSHLNLKFVKIPAADEIKKIETNLYSFVGVQEWYDEETLFYLSDENGYSYLYTFNLFTGEEQVFFEITEPIISIEANPTYSYFAIRVARLNGNIDLYLVNKNGDEKMLLKDVGEDFHLHWNQYLPNELVIIALQPDYTFQHFYVDITKKTTNEFHNKHFYIQWMAENQFAFLDWDMFEPSYFASLYLYDLEKNEQQLLQNEVISFFSFDKYYLTVSVKANTAIDSDYIFYDTIDKSETAKLKVPILNTYSEQWWIPNHEFDNKTTTFYYMKPKTHGNLYEYSEQFYLMAFHLLTNEERKIVQLEKNYPLRLSPDGRWLLVGHQLENIVDLKTNETHSLIHW